MQSLEFINNGTVPRIVLRHVFIDLRYKKPLAHALSIHPHTAAYTTQSTLHRNFQHSTGKSSNFKDPTHTISKMCTETETAYHLCRHAVTRTTRACPYAREMQFDHLHHEHRMREVADCPYYLLERARSVSLCPRCKREVYGRQRGNNRERRERREQEGGLECLCVVQ